MLYFENVPYHSYDDITIKVDGEYAVIEGELQDGFTTVRQSCSGGHIQWGVRRNSELPTRSILVQAWCGASCSTHEQRFYVKGSRITISGHADSDIWVEGNAIHTHGNRWDIPPQILKGEYVIKKRGNSWLCVSLFDSALFWMTPKKIVKVHHPGVSKMVVDNKNINLQVYKNCTYHLPLSYELSHVEDSVLDWFKFQHTGTWDVHFTDRMHIWRRGDRFIFKHDPEPISGDCYNMMWTLEDMQVKKMKSLTVCNSQHILVNGTRYINTRYPEVIHVAEA